MQHLFALIFHPMNLFYTLFTFLLLIRLLAYGRKSIMDAITTYNFRWSSDCKFYDDWKKSPSDTLFETDLIWEVHRMWWVYLLIWIHLERVLFFKTFAFESKLHPKYFCFVRTTQKMDLIRGCRMGWITQKLDMTACHSDCIFWCSTPPPIEIMEPNHLFAY